MNNSNLMEERKTYVSPDVSVISYEKTDIVTDSDDWGEWDINDSNAAMPTAFKFKDSWED